MCKLFILPDRKASTFQRLIKENVCRGATIHHDGFPAYKSVKWRQLGIKDVNHPHRSKENPQLRFERSNYIEALWSILKRWLIRIYSGPNSSDSFIFFVFECLWRSHIRACDEEYRAARIKADIKEFYELDFSVKHEEENGI